jgi:hypothetical protein
VNNIKMDLRVIGWDGMDWIDLAQNGDQRRVLVNDVTLSGSISCIIVWFSRRAQHHD